MKALDDQNKPKPRDHEWGALFMVLFIWGVFVFALTTGLAWQQKRLHAQAATEARDTLDRGSWGLP